MCISNFSKEDRGNHNNAQPYWIQYYYNENYDDYIKDCYGREDSKVCKFFIQNAKESDSGKYECVSENRMECTMDKLTLEFKGKSWHFDRDVVISKALLIIRRITKFIFFQEGTVTNPAIWLVLSVVRIFLSLTTVTLTLSQRVKSSCWSIFREWTSGNRQPSTFLHFHRRLIYRSLSHFKSSL